MPVMLLLPITGLITAIILLGEEPSKQVFLGGTIIIFGVSLILFNFANNWNPLHINKIGLFFSEK